MLIIIEYKELCCLISSSRVIFSRNWIKSILVLSQVAGWAVGLFKYFLVVWGKGIFFRSLSITCSIPNFFSPNWQLLKPNSDFSFCQQGGSCWTRLWFQFFFLSVRWQLLNPIPNPIPIFFFSKVAVAETDTDSETETVFFFSIGNCWNRLRNFSDKVSVAETDSVFFCSPNSATVAVVVAETDFFFSRNIPPFDCN